MSTSKTVMTAAYALCPIMCTPSRSVAVARTWGDL
jgi:hypothetical protein